MIFTTKCRVSFLSSLHQHILKLLVNLISFFNWCHRSTRSSKMERNTYFQLSAPIWNLLVITITLASTVNAEPTLRQLHVIIRHGARTALPKDADTLLEEVGSTLTPLGQKNEYDLGVWLRRTYGDRIGKSYDPSKHRFESSSLDRTIVSANSLALGLFPLESRGSSLLYSSSSDTPIMSINNIPVYSTSINNDIAIRSYSNCNTFNRRLQELYDNNTEWDKLEQENSALLEHMAELAPEYTGGNGKLELEELWNVYDVIHVAKTECNSTLYNDSSAGFCTGVDRPDLANALSDQEWDQLKTVTSQAELLKYGMKTAGNLLGSNLLWKILHRVDTRGEFFLYSAHYPTILGLFSTLQKEVIDHVLPDYAAALIFEIYKESNMSAPVRNFLRILYKQGGASEAQPVSLNNIGCDNNDQDAVNLCPLDTLLLWASENTLTTEEAWCDACQNEQANACLVQLLNRLSTDSSLSSSTSGQKFKKKNLSIVTSVIGGILIGFMLSTMTLLSVYQKKRTNEVTMEMPS